jgi:putative hydrolase of the HAD superfamily
VERHAAAYETGKLDLEQFFDRTVFYEPRPFAADEFRTFVFGLSRPHPEVLEIGRWVERTHRYRMVALNNEGAEFNEHRIGSFGLRGLLSAFFSSCYTGIRKPESRAYRLVNEVLQVAPSDCLFIDDRRENIDAATRAGWKAIRFESAPQLRECLHQEGVLPR